MAHVLDTTRDCLNLATCLKQQGYTTLIRYYCRADITWKRMMPKEAVALSRAGLKLAAVYQNRQNQPQDFSEAKGKAAGRDAYDYAENSIFQPAGSAIYFSVDFDPSEAVVKNNVVPFFAGIKKAFKEAAGGGAPDYKIGVYGSGPHVPNPSRWQAGRIYLALPIDRLRRIRKISQFVGLESQAEYAEEGVRHRLRSRRGQPE